MTPYVIGKCAGRIGKMRWSKKSSIPPCFQGEILMKIWPRRAHITTLYIRSTLSERKARADRDSSCEHFPSHIPRQEPAIAQSSVV